MTLRNPILHRELLTLLRSRKAFALLAVYVGLTGLLLLAAWPEGATSLLSQGGVSRRVFGLFAAGQTALLALMIPATAGPAMTVEKEGGTLDLLLTTPLSSNQIVLGKLLSGLAYFLLLAVASVPLLLLCFVIGGIAASDVLGLYGYFLAQTILYGLTALNLSIWFHRTHIAVILAYVAVGAEAAVLGAVYGDGIGFLGSGPSVAMAVLGGSTCAVLYATAVAGARRPWTRAARPLEEEDHREIVGLVIQRDAFPDNLIVPPWRGDVMPDGGNPVLEKELQAGVYGSGSLFIRLVIQGGVLAALVALIYMSVDRTFISNPFAAGRGHPEFIQIAFAIGYVMVLAPALAARAFTSEREEETLEQLLLTPLPRRKIVLGKFLAVLRVVVVLSALNTIPFAIVALLHLRANQLLVLAAVVVSTGALTTALALFLSLVCRTTLAAMVSTYLAILVLFLGPVLARTFLDRLYPAAALAGAVALDLASPFLACRLDPEAGTADQALRLGVHALASAALATILLVSTGAWFDRAVGRASEKG